MEAVRHGNRQVSALCCSVLQCGAMCCSVLQYAEAVTHVNRQMLQCVALCGSVLHRVAMCRIPMCRADMYV